VHCLNNLGTVVTHAAHLTSREGFEAEWRTIDILTVDGDLIQRAELFDEADLGAALARFDELTRPATRLENAAARVFHHVWSHYAAGDWEAVAATVADDYLGIDRRGRERRDSTGPTCCVSDLRRRERRLHDIHVERLQSAVIVSSSPVFAPPA